MNTFDQCKADANAMQTICKTDANAYINQETKNTSKSIGDSQASKASHRPLRPYQGQAILSLRQSLGSGHKRPVLHLPTGAGKTRVAGEIVRMARAKGTRVMFVVPAISLIDQTVESFAADGILDVGVIQADHWMTKPEAPVQVCSLQTLERRDLPLGIGLVIVDECHRQSKFVRRWINDWKSVPFIGLSATPWARGMAKDWDDLIVASTTERMIAEGWLSPFVVYAPMRPDLSGVKIVAGDYHEGQLGDAMDKPPLIADIVDSWRRLGEGQPTLLFAVNRAHADHCRNEFESAGIRAAYIDAYTDPDERRIIGGQLARGDVKVVCNVGCLTTGVDWDVRCIVLARPTRSEMLFVQMVGRGLRLAEGKERCILIDHSDTHHRLGFVTDIHHDRLYGGEKGESAPQKKQEALPKECPNCKRLRPPKMSTCPGCGFVAKRFSDVSHVDGDLELLESRKAKQKVSKDDKQSFYSMLYSHAQSKGYKPGWISHKYKEKFGVWPQGMVDRHAERYTPEFMSWLRSQQIRAAKRAQKLEEGLAALEGLLKR